MMSILRRIYRYRGVLVAPPLLLTLLSNFHKTEDGLLTWTAGTALVLLGTGIRVLAQQHIHHRIKARQDLTTTGPYSKIRNPLYVGNTLICLGATVASKLLWFTPITLLYCFVLYSLVVRYEERRLIDEYGEPYRKYLSEVPRWLPRTWRFRSRNLANPHFLHAVAAESPCLLILIPYILKDIFT
jgi:protein-S-isoprenylcysteine O-methyltransferase Ste14